jgi:hypothetical protein
MAWSRNPNVKEGLTVWESDSTSCYPKLILDKTTIPSQLLIEFEASDPEIELYKSKLNDLEIIFNESLTTVSGNKIIVINIVNDNTLDEILTKTGSVLAPANPNYFKNDVYSNQTGLNKPRGPKTRPKSKKIADITPKNKAIFNPDEIESAMTTLSNWQLDIMQKIAKKYEEQMMLRNGEDGVIADLKQFLAQKYLQNPAIFIHEGRKIALPLENDHLEDTLLKNNLHITDDILDAVNRLYYAHADHTAYRYFLKPNPWMDPNALNVNGDAQRGTGYSDYENHKTSIALFWLAASDPKEAAKDKLSVVDRQGGYIAAVVDIARDANGKLGYDDKKGDKPGCRMGVVSRIFTSVLDHSLFNVNPDEILNMEMQKILHNFYSYLFNNMTLNELQAIQQGMIDAEFVAVQNLSSEAKQNFIKDLKDNLGHFDQQLMTPIINKISKILDIEQKNPNVNPEDCDFYKFYTAYGVGSVFENALKEKVAASKKHESGDNQSI